MVVLHSPFSYDKHFPTFLFMVKDFLWAGSDMKDTT